MGGYSHFPAFGGVNVLPVTSHLCFHVPAIPKQDAFDLLESHSLIIRIMRMAV